MTSISAIGRRRQRGFTLVEALVAFAILVLATVGMIWSRTNSIQKAAEARNLRLAVKIAMETLDHLQAGMNETDIFELNDWLPQENYKGYDVRVVVGATHIEDFREEVASLTDDEAALKKLDLEERLREERETKALDAGEPLPGEEEDALESGEQTIDEETFEEVIVAVRYPTFDFEKYPSGLAVYSLQANLTTLAISGKTPEQAQEDAKSKAAVGEGDAGGGGL